MSDSVTLHNGETLHISVLNPPLADNLTHLVWWNIAKPELVSGAVSPWLHTAYYVGKINGSIAGTLACYKPADTHDIGVIEFVKTEEQHRHKGIADAILGLAIDHFRTSGGKALYLCTANPSAGALYEKHGFKYHLGDGMRYLAPGFENFDETNFRYSGAGTVRNAHWGDLPRVSALYNHDQPDWLIKDYLSQSFVDTRFEQHFMKLMKRTEGDDGDYLVMESPEHSVVGAAAILRFDSYYEQHVAELTLRVVPAYDDHIGEMFLMAEERARNLGISIPQIHAAQCDTSQLAHLKDAGFSEQGRFKEHLMTDEGLIDMLIYRKRLGTPPARTYTRDHYYGGRFVWQQNKIDQEGATCQSK